MLIPAFQKTQQVGRHSHSQWTGMHQKAQEEVKALFMSSEIYLIPKMEYFQRQQYHSLQEILMRYRESFSESLNEDCVMNYIMNHSQTSQLGTERRNWKERNFTGGRAMFANTPGILRHKGNCSHLACCTLMKSLHAFSLVSSAQWSFHSTIETASVYKQSATTSIQKMVDASVNHW